METKFLKGVWAILYILDIKFYKKQGIVYAIVSLCTLIFGLIYEMFSHNVVSNYMIFAFVIPLTIGAIVSIIMYKLKIKKLTRAQINLYNASIATLTVWSIIKGILEIYGTTNWKVNIYLVVSILLLFGSLVVNKVAKKKPGYNL